MNSYAELIEVPCATCQRAVQGKLWLIVDTVERPDLVKQIQRGKLHRVVCPDCGQVAAAPDQPLLIYRPEAEPVLLFSPAQHTSQEEDRAAAARLVAQLQERLGDQWQDDWGEELPAIPRQIVPQVLEGNLEQAVQQMQAEMQQALAALQPQSPDPPAGLPALAALAELLIETFVKAQTWVESQRVVEQHPELLAEPADWVLAQLIPAQDTDGARQVLQEHRELLQRCRQVGIEQAFQEKTGRNSTAGRQVPAGLRPLLQRLKQLNRPTDHPERIQILRQALIQVTQADNPQLWAALQGELGNSYAQSFQGQRFQNIEDAITAYQHSLTVMTQAAMPVEWATTMMNLATAYSDRIRGDKAQNIEDAITAYHHSLTVTTPTTNPYDCLIAARGLGNLHFTRGNWQLALDEGYRRAIQAVEQTRTWASSDERKQEVLENAIGVYDNALQCHINLGQYDAAILLTERARSRHLVDLMHSNDLYQGGDIPTEIQQYLDEYEHLQQQINQLRQQQRRDDTALSGSQLRFKLHDQATIKVTVEALLQQKAAVWGKLRAQDRVLAEQLEVPHLDFDQLANLITDQPTTAILSCYSTNEHTYIFVVRHSATGITCDLHTCLDQGYQTLQNWIRNQWLVPYKVDFDTWIEQMPQQLSNLAQRLQLNALIATHLQGITDLILIPHIFLHLIPFAALPLTPNPAPGGRGEPAKPEYLGDRFRLRTAPSLQVLKYCHDRENSDFAPAVPGSGFGSVEDATGDRPIIVSGFESIAQRLQIPDSQRLRGPQEATLTNYRQLIRNPNIQALHLIHHAGSDLENPLESALLLANHERLTLGQLMSPGWRMPHLVEVFLSCCETNLGTPNLADDLPTLATGFLCAGARVVISTLWSVDALATTLFCDFYYQFREQGSDRPTALQQAQQAMQNLSGDQLKVNSQSFYRQLEQQWQQSEQQHQNYRKQLRALSVQDPKYDKVQKELEYWTRLKKDLDNSFYYFEQHQKQAQPFSHPFYWGGFVCQGLR